jgi:flagellar M-ring protein FliF
VVMFMVVRPLVRRILASEPVNALSAPGGAAALTDGTMVGPDGHMLVPNAAPNMIDIATIQGQVHAQSVHRVGELADRNPNETAAIVRQWLQEPA